MEDAHYAKCSGGSSEEEQEYGAAARVDSVVPAEEQQPRKVMPLLPLFRAPEERPQCKRGRCVLLRALLGAAVAALVLLVVLRGPGMPRPHCRGGVPLPRNYMNATLVGDAVSACAEAFRACMPGQSEAMPAIPKEYLFVDACYVREMSLCALASSTTSDVLDATCQQALQVLESSDEALDDHEEQEGRDRHNHHHHSPRPHPPGQPGDYESPPPPPLFRHDEPKGWFGGAAPGKGERGPHPPPPPMPRLPLAVAAAAGMLMGGLAVHLVHMRRTQYATPCTAESEAAFLPDTKL